MGEFLYFNKGLVMDRNIEDRNRWLLNWVGGEVGMLLVRVY